VDLGRPPSLQITGSLTISAWVYSSSFPVDDAAIVSNRDSSNHGFQLDTTVDQGSRTVGFKLSGPSGATFARYGTTVLAPNTWYYLTGVYDAVNRTLDVYVNGQLDNGVLEGTVPGAQTNSSKNVQIGQRPGYPGSFNFKGILDDVRIYNRALSQAEIQADMNTPVG
jgi:hypothetical protein